MAEKYRPSSGTEGMAFMATWCDRCTKDAAFRADQGVSGCDIIIRAELHDITEPEYPTEWVRDEAGPRCTAFEEAPA